MATSMIVSHRGGSESDGANRFFESKMNKKAE